MLTPASTEQELNVITTVVPMLLSAYRCCADSVLMSYESFDNCYGRWQSKRYLAILLRKKSSQELKFHMDNFRS